MIGNDVVDLQLAKTQSNWQRKGFLEKQFTEEEQQTILNSENPFLQVWLFWSMKEAAYKCYVQEHQKRFFAPKKFKCKIVPVYIERIHGVNFKLTIHDPIKYSNNESIESITLSLNILLEKMILKNPEQWIWSHNRWK